MSLPSSETASKALLKHTIVANYLQYELLIESSEMLQVGFISTHTAKQVLPIKINSQALSITGNINPLHLLPERTTALLLLDRSMPKQLLQQATPVKAA